MNDNQDINDQGRVPLHLSNPQPVLDTNKRIHGFEHPPRTPSSELLNAWLQRLDALGGPISEQVRELIPSHDNTELPSHQPPLTSTNDTDLQ